MVVTKTTTEVFAGSADVFYDGVTLGHTQGAIEVSITKTAFDVNVNDFGPNVAVASFSQGVGASVTIPLAQYSVPVLLTAMPEAVAVSGTAALYMGDTTGTNLLSLAKNLLIVPRNGSVQFFAPAAASTGDLTFSYAQDGQLITNTTFRCYPDPANPTASGSVFRIEPNSIY